MREPLFVDEAGNRADRAQREIMDALRALQEQSGIMDELKAMRDENQEMKRDFNKVQATLEQVLAQQPLPPSSSWRESPRAVKPAARLLGGDVPSPDRKAVLAASDLTFMVPDHHALALSGSNLAPASSPPEDATYGSVAIETTVGAHRLLRWPTIKALFAHRPLSEDYVMENEMRKGLLRLYGRGQGRDTFDGGQTGPASPSTNSSSGRSDDLSRSPAASPPDLWGTSLGTPGGLDGRYAVSDHPGGLNPDGTLKVDQLTRDRLLDSYLNNIHILHPFLSKTRLKRMFDRFGAHSGPPEPPRPSPYAGHINPPLLPLDATSNKSQKRKHSAATGGSPHEILATAFSGRSGGGEPRLERRISTAIVLLVMALGKICAHTGDLPGPVRDHVKDSSAGGDRRPHSPLQTESPPSTAFRPSPTTSSASISSPMSDLRASVMSRSSTEPFGCPPGPRPEKNVDVIPGLAYFARATDILGNLHGGNDLSHVQANLLAGLYASQMACVIESWSWIQTACRACHFLIRE